MSGCDWQNKTFTVSVTGNRTKKLCEVCKEYISDYIREANGVKMCKECFNKAISSKEIGLFRVDAFREVNDRDAGISYSSIREKHRKMKEKGIAYAEDYKQNRDLGKEAEFRFGKQGNRKLGDKNGRRT